MPKVNRCRSVNPNRFDQVTHHVKNLHVCTWLICKSHIQFVVRKIHAKRFLFSVNRRTFVRRTRELLTAARFCTITTTGLRSTATRNRAGGIIRICRDVDRRRSLRIIAIPLGGYANGQYPVSNILRNASRDNDKILFVILADFEAVENLLHDGFGRT